MNLNTYRISDEAAMESNMARGTSATDAIFRWIGGGYRTANADDECTPEGGEFSRLSVWEVNEASGEETYMGKAIICADGRGGIGGVEIKL